MRRISFLICFFIISTWCSFQGLKTFAAEPDPAALLNNSQQTELRIIREKAVKKAAQNLNRFAIEDLKSYESMLDSAINAKLLDSVRVLEKGYDLSTGGRQEQLQKNKDAISELTIAKASNLSRYNKLLKKAGIAFGAWLLIVIIILQIRKSHLRKQGKTLRENIVKLEASRNRSSFGEKLLAATKFTIVQSEKIQQSSAALKSSGSKFATVLSEKVNTLNSIASTELKICRFILTFGEKSADEKHDVNINDICETAIAVTARKVSVSIPSEVLSITKDLEKNLPKISLVPASVNALLMNILNNSCQAIQKKYDEGIKGYQPKIALSTRILPRFLQIRIRDNGSGIPKEEIEKVMTEFYSLRPLEEGAGLGLPDSLALLSEPHKGELRIESDPQDGTDVYIKFFI